ncbi:hypothetical protein ACFLZ7_00110 [Nanoarchaeota archaeon]
MPEETNLFVRFEDPGSLRKSVLEASRHVLVSLQGFERFKEVRAQKTDVMGQLKNQISEVNSLFNQLRKEMPKTSTVKIKKVPVIKKPVSAEPGELKGIEDQLSDIESALGDLS